MNKCFESKIIVWMQKRWFELKIDVYINKHIYKYYKISERSNKVHSMTAEKIVFRIFLDI